MLALFAEGLETAFSPCTLVLLLPGIAVTFASRYYSSLAILGFIAGVALTAWLWFSNTIGTLPTVFVAILILAAGLLFLRPVTDRLELTSVSAGALVGIGLVYLWEPCAGDAFGSLITDLDGMGASGASAVGMLLYVVGLLAPLIMLGAGFYLLPDHFQVRIERPLAYLGALSLIVAAFAVLIGVHETAIDELVEWSARPRATRS